jgi:hypothetical protein
VTKEKQGGDALRLCFPDLYEGGHVPSLGMKILYSLHSRAGDMLCERVLRQMLISGQMEEHHIPLYGLESFDTNLHL